MMMMDCGPCYAFIATNYAHFYYYLHAVRLFVDLLSVYCTFRECCNLKSFQ